METLHAKQRPNLGPVDMRVMEGLGGRLSRTDGRIRQLRSPARRRASNKPRVNLSISLEEEGTGLA